MAIVVKAEPAGARYIIHDALARRRHRAHHLPALRGAVRVGTPLPIYVLDHREAYRGASLAAARRVGWRYPIIGGASPGFAMLNDEAGRLSFAGVGHGRLAERLLQAAVLAEDNLAARDESYEPRLLEIPSLRLCALWLHGPQDFFIVLVDGQRPAVADLQLERDIGRRIVAAAARLQVRRSAALAAGRGLAPSRPGKRQVGLLILLLSALALAAAFAPAWIDALNVTPLAVWLIELASVAALFVALGLRFNGRWFGLLVDGRNKLSLSRLQLALWTLLFTVTLYVVYVWNVEHAKTGDVVAALGVLTVPGTAWLLMGMSGISAAGSPAILSLKPARDPGGSPLPLPADRAKFLDGMVVKRRADETPRWSDILLGDEAGNANTVDISKMQQLLLSLVAVVVYGYAIARCLAEAKGIAVPKLPQMSDGFLALIGASHATYLIYKGVSHTN